MLLSSENVSARLHVVKVLQRIALIYLKPKQATWRYKCGVRSLEENLKTTIINNASGDNYSSNVLNNDVDDEEEDITDLEADLEKFVSVCFEAQIIYNNSLD